MPRWLRIIGYVFFGLFAFVIFLYLTFPFEIMKDRIVAGAENSFKGKYQVDVGSVSPRLLAGVTLKDCKVSERGEQGIVPVWEAQKIKLKASLLSFIFGRPKVNFGIDSGNGSIDGSIRVGNNAYSLEADIDEFDLGKIYFLANKLGLNLKSKVNGSIKLDFQPNQIIRSSGDIKIEPNGIQVLASKIDTGSMGAIEVPALTIGAGNSLISAEIKSGAIKINSFKFEQGDLNLDLKGSIYLASDAGNLRLNLKGTFSFSDKIEQTLPFLFIIEKQKNEDGSFPLTIAGRLSRPQIKIGDFTVPL